MFSRNTAHLMISQKINVMSSFNYISYRITSFGAIVMKGNSFFHSNLNLKVVLVVEVLASLKRFTFFLSGLDDSAIFKLCLENLLKDSYMSKNVVSKKKANYKLMLLVHKEKNSQEIIKINITKLNFYLNGAVL